LCIGTFAGTFAQVASNEEILSFIRGNNIFIQEEFGPEADRTINIFDINFCGENDYTMTITTIRRTAGLPERTQQETLSGYWKFHVWSGYNCIHYNKQFQDRTLIHALLKDDNGGLKLYNNQSILNMGEANCL
jgi:hypothetical protein